MLTTIVIGSCMFVQGQFVARDAAGRVTVRVGAMQFTGRPVHRGGGLAVSPASP